MPAGLVDFNKFLSGVLWPQHPCRNSAAV